jgi:hypothetical protein
MQRSDDQGEGMNLLAGDRRSLAESGGFRRGGLEAKIEEGPDGCHRGARAVERLQGMSSSSATAMRYGAIARSCHPDTARPDLAIPTDQFRSRKNAIAAL